ncbi:hypothetical protein OS493_033780 [Desmophyllum pertusum]|uniref:VWFA domain-containing protein n=1 Tax=Desmophyllum pertusum TaxID=174260 RepID=A0A9X0CNS9_9CNID|nr:hypothetical protein OS493_033780 [Desmophyllum pertusum]
MMNMIVLVLVTLLAVRSVHCQEGNSLQGIRGTDGDCPYQRPEANCQQGLRFSSDDDSECFSDDECLPSLKCCLQGCASRCVAPVYYRRWCSVPVDLGILFETQAATWPKVKKMINKVIHRMSITNDGTHFAMRSIAERSQLLLAFDELRDRQMNRFNVLRVIKALAPQKRTGRISTALEAAKEMFNQTNGARENAIKVLLVLTDANMDSDDSSVVNAASKSLRESGILVQTVGVTLDMNLMQLVDMATSDLYVWPGVDTEMLWLLKKTGKSTM